MNGFSIDELKRCVTSMIEKSVAEEIDEAIGRVKLEIEDKIRKSTGSICARALSFYDFHFDNNRMVITVNFKNVKEVTNDNY